jgi:hypothetical protein
VKERGEERVWRKDAHQGEEGRTIVRDCKLERRTIVEKGAH